MEDVLIQLLTRTSILDACIPIIQGQVNSCGVTDYACLCTQYQNMLTCYINCPSDPGVFTVQQQREQNCIAASVYGSTTTLGTAPAATSAASATTTGSSSDTSIHTGFASETGSSATSTTSSSATGNGAVGFEIAGGLVAVALGGLGFVL